MTEEEILDAFLQDRISHHEDLIVEGVTTSNGVILINEFAALRVAAISSAVCQLTDAEVVDASGQPLGTLCFTRNLGNVARADLTLWQYIAFLADADLDEIEELHYSFKSDYVILHSSRIEDYQHNYAKSAPLWGRFSHVPLAQIEYPKAVDPIVAVPGIEIASDHHKEAFERYLRANNPLERYLRLYQSVELLFDYVVVKKIKALGDDLSGVSHLLSDFGKTELDRLKAIMKEFCENPISLASKIELSSRFKDYREEIFFEHSKAGNPYADAERWEKLKTIIDGSSLNEEALRRGSFVNTKNSFSKVINDLCAYWVYRIRCSIAHNRSGEFLLEDKHATFIADFAEPMMLEIVKQIFASTTFKAL